jgi:hypothetical protein
MQGSEGEGAEKHTNLIRQKSLEFILQIVFTKSSIKLTTLSLSLTCFFYMYGTLCSISWQLE